MSETNITAEQEKNQLKAGQAEETKQAAEPLELHDLLDKLSKDKGHYLDVAKKDSGSEERERETAGDTLRATLLSIYYYIDDKIQNPQEDNMHNPKKDVQGLIFSTVDFVPEKSFIDDHVVDDINTKIDDIIKTCNQLEPAEQVAADQAVEMQATVEPSKPHDKTQTVNADGNSTKVPSDSDQLSKAGSKQVANTLGNVESQKSLEQRFTDSVHNMLDKLAIQKNIYHTIIDADVSKEQIEKAGNDHAETTTDMISSLNDLNTLLKDNLQLSQNQNSEELLSAEVPMSNAQIQKNLKGIINVQYDEDNEKFTKALQSQITEKIAELNKPLEKRVNEYSLKNVFSLFKNKIPKHHETELEQKYWEAIHRIGQEAPIAVNDIQNLQVNALQKWARLQKQESEVQQELGKAQSTFDQGKQKIDDENKAQVKKIYHELLKSHPATAPIFKLLQEKSQEACVNQMVDFAKLNYTGMIANSEQISAMKLATGDENKVHDMFSQLNTHVSSHRTEVNYLKDILAFEKDLVNSLAKDFNTRYGSNMATERYKKDILKDEFIGVKFLLEFENDGSKNMVNKVIQKFQKELVNEKEQPFWHKILTQGLQEGDNLHLESKSYAQHTNKTDFIKTASSETKFSGGIKNAFVNTLKTQDKLYHAITTPRQRRNINSPFFNLLQDAKKFINTVGPTVKSLAEIPFNVMKYTAKAVVGLIVAIVTIPSIFVAQGVRGSVEGGKDLYKNRNKIQAQAVGFFSSTNSNESKKATQKTTTKAQKLNNSPGVN